VEELTSGWELMQPIVSGGTADELLRIAEEEKRSILAGR
jgi:hypothetical protein